MTTRTLLFGLAAVLALALIIYAWTTSPTSGEFASVDPGTFDLKSHQGQELRGYLYRGDTSAHEMLVTHRSTDYRLPMDGDLWTTIDARVTDPGVGATSCLGYAAKCLDLAANLLWETGSTARCDHVNAPLTDTCTPSTASPQVLRPRVYQVRANGDPALIGYLCVASNGQEAWLTQNGASPPYTDGLQLTPHDLAGVSDCQCSGGSGTTATEFFDVATQALGLSKADVTELHGNVQFQTSCADIKVVNRLFETLDQADDGEVEPDEVLSKLVEVKGDLDVDIEPLLDWLRGELAATSSDPDHPSGGTVSTREMVGASIDDGTWQIWVGGELKGFALRFDDGTLELMAVQGAMPLVADQIDFLKIGDGQSYDADELEQITAWWQRLATDEGLTASDYSVLVVRDEKLKVNVNNCPTEKPQLAIGAGTYEVRNLEEVDPGEFEIGTLRGMYLSSGSGAEGQELYHLKTFINLPLTANNDGFSLVKSNELPNLDSFSCDPADATYFAAVVAQLDDAYDAPFGDYARFMKRTQVSYTPNTTP